MLHATVNEEKTFAIEHVDGQWLKDGERTDWDMIRQPNGMASVLYKGRSYTVLVEKKDLKTKEITLRVNDQLYTVSLKGKLDLLLERMGIDTKAAQKAEPLRAPMPGMVLQVLVSEGQEVAKGDGLIVLEAMKMENIIKAPAAGTIKKIKAVERTAVEKGVVLIEME